MTKNNSHWIATPLKEVLVYLDERVEIDDMKEYITITVKRRHGGLEPRERLYGHQIKTKKQFRLIPGAFIISRVQCWHQAYAIVPDNLLPNTIASTNYDQFTISQGVDRRFFWWLSHSPLFNETVRNSASGVVIEKMVFDRETWLEKTIPLPSLEQQRRIAAKIDALAAEIEGIYGLQVKSTQELYFLYDLAVQSICYAGKYPLSTFGEVLSEAKNGIYKPPEFWGRGIPCIRMYNIDGPSMNTINLQLLDVTEDEFSTYSCQSGDLVFNRVNSAELVGKTGIITEKYPKCTFESKNMRLRVKQERVMPEFVAIILNSRKTKEYYRRVLKQQCGMATLNQGHVRNIPFPIPSLLEQEHIVAHIDSLKTKVEELDNLKVQALAELDALMPSILDKAFKGEL